MTVFTGIRTAILLVFAPAVRGKMPPGPVPHFQRNDWTGTQFNSDSGAEAEARAHRWWWRKGGWEKIRTGRRGKSRWEYGGRRRFRWSAGHVGAWGRRCGSVRWRRGQRGGSRGWLRGGSDGESTEGAGFHPHASLISIVQLNCVRKACVMNPLSAWTMRTV